MRKHTDEQKKRISELHTQGYTVPWAFYRDQYDQLWVRGDYPVFLESGGTADVKVTRDGRGNLYIDRPIIRRYRGDAVDPITISNKLIDMWKMEPVNEHGPIYYPKKRMFKLSFTLNWEWV